MRLISSILSKRKRDETSTIYFDTDGDGKTKFGEASQNHDLPTNKKCIQHPTLS